MIHRKPEGYKDLLVYQKAALLQEDTFKFTAQFPKTETLVKLADQMDRSARSGTKNIVEGWKRNTTKEYFDFLGFSIASIEELKDDYADIARGLYRDLMGVKGVMGVMGEKGEMGIVGGKGEKGSNDPLTPLNPIPPTAPRKPLNPLNPIPPSSSQPVSPVKPLSPSSSQPLTPLNPITPIWSASRLEQLKFYPLDPSLPPVVQLYLRCKEVLMLLDKLQRSLDSKMDRELTKPSNERARQRILNFEKEGKDLLKEIEKTGLVRLVDGRFISKEEFERLESEGKKPKLFGE